MLSRTSLRSINTAATATTSRWLAPRCAVLAASPSRWVSPRIKSSRGYASNITTVTSPKIVKPLAPYSHAVKANGFVYMSGMIPMTADGSKIEGDIKDNTRQVLENIKAVLEESGSSLEQVLKVNIYITDMAKFSEINSVYSEYFNTHKPARTCVSVKELPMNFEVEMECVALY
ncbi:YjgF-like protein [Nadsonia fulvescens var. elongata DSM 6958]|uniref:YjgF-like protein n=1 Tax=Nadsonia fulvescens var. elongata DSM 6958 TaxID=857566 RepID=A0A1E3PCX5_9ASCO|nr:YjgF-like protein [Nadsonia fulvescens var. elongata DSM 6958]